jgi:hypothetical protein
MTIEDNHDSIYQIRSLLGDKKLLDKLYDNKSELSDFLLSILEDSRYDLIARAEIAWDDLYKITNRSDQDPNVFIIIKDKVRLQKVLLGCLKDAMRVSNEVNGLINDIYIKNLEDIEPGTRIIKITSEANKLMREFIAQHPYAYLKNYFLREYPEPSLSGRFYNLDPFFIYYFDHDWNLAFKFLTSESVKELFNKNEEELEFYEILLQAANLSQRSKSEKFLISDKNQIKLIGKFILLKQFR